MPRSGPDIQLEFTIEPFVEGNPGPHVRAAVAAADALGAPVEFGPFGSTCRATAAAMPGIVAAIVREAFANGATHVSLHVSQRGIDNDVVGPLADREGGSDT